MGSAVRLTEHFDLSEFTVSQTASRYGLDNTPNDEIIQNLHNLAETLEDVRKVLGKPIIISSGYRSIAVNRLVGGAANSFHTKGLAADFTCPGFGNVDSVCRALYPKMQEFGIDQLIKEFNSWTHLGIAASNTNARHMALTIDTNGTSIGFV